LVTLAVLVVLLATADEAAASVVVAAWTATLAVNPKPQLMTNKLMIDFILDFLFFFMYVNFPVRRNS